MNDFILQPSDNPGAHERHLNRKHNNPLFGSRQLTRNQQTMLDVQEKDHQVLLDFHKDFQGIIEQTIQLKPNEDSDVILKLKDKLDKLYERASIIADDQRETKQAIRQLLKVIMTSVRKGAGTDVQAHKELDQEEAARDAHFLMLENKLVADLLDPDSVIHKDELVPTLLSAEKEELAAAVQLFDENQLTLIIREGEDLLNTLNSPPQAIAGAAENLVFIQGYIDYLNLMDDTSD